MYLGYGLLSENFVFVDVVIYVGMIWIGFFIEVMNIMVFKIEVCVIMIKVGVFVVFGGAVEDVEVVGFFLLIKVSVGGGGKGMCWVDFVDEFFDVLMVCWCEVAKSFGDDMVYFE